jgi:hypothetical protein
MDPEGLSKALLSHKASFWREPVRSDESAPLETAQLDAGIKELYKKSIKAAKQGPPAVTRARILVLDEHLRRLNVAHVKACVKVSERPC